MSNQTPLPGTFGIVLLGMMQVLVWGGSFFLMAVMADPIIEETGWASQWVYGALSLSILVSAMLAPLISRLIARYGGRPVLASSGLGVAIGLFLMANATSLPFFLLAWSVIGIGMALGLYEALFACLGSLYGEQAGGAITGITLISGFATTLSWPAVALVIEYVGWRSTCLAYGALLVLTVAPLYMWVLPRGSVFHTKNDALADEGLSIDRRIYWLLTMIFALGAVIMTAISVQLISLLQGQGYSLSAAIGLSALLGPSQVGSRVLQVFSRKRHPIWTTLISVVLRVNRSVGCDYGTGNDCSGSRTLRCWKWFTSDCPGAVATDADVANALCFAHGAHGSTFTRWTSTDTSCRGLPFANAGGGRRTCWAKLAGDVECDTGVASIYSSFEKYDPRVQVYPVR